MSQYKRLDHVFIVDALMGFNESPEQHFCEYSNAKDLAAKRVSIMHIGNKVGLLKARSDKIPASFIYKKSLLTLISKEKMRERR